MKVGCKLVTLKLLGSLSAALCMCNAASAATPIDGLYASVFGGYTYLPNNVSVTRYGLTRTDTSYQGGFDAGGSIGYKNNPLRYEGQLTYLTANLKNFKINNVSQTGVTGYSNGVLAMANVYYDLPELVCAFQPFVGVGLGYTWINAKLQATGPTFASKYTGTNSLFAYQATAGITYDFAENYALNIGYRYLATEHSYNLGKIFQAHMANVGAVYRFNEGNYK